MSELGPEGDVACSGCGHRPWPGESFCSRCGTALVVERPGVRGAALGTDHELQLESGRPHEGGVLDAAGRPSDHADDGQPSQPAWMPMLGLMLAAGLLGLVGWSLVSDGEETTPAAATTDRLDPTAGATRLAVPTPTPLANPTAAALLQVPFGPELSLPPERRAALDAMYGTTSIGQLEAGQGALAIAYSRGAFLVDIGTGEAELSTSWEQEHVGQLLITDHGVVRAPDSGGVFFHPWGTTESTAINESSARLGSSIGDWLVTFDPDHEWDTNPVVTNLVTLESRPVRLPIQPGPHIGLLADGSVVTANGGRVFATGALVAGSLGGELLPSSGTSVMLTSCSGLPGNCETRLFDRLDPRLLERNGFVVRTLHQSEVVGNVSLLASVGGVAYWSAGPQAGQQAGYELVIRKEIEGSGITRFVRTVPGLTIGQLHWTPNGLGLFHLPEGGGSLSYVDIRRQQASELRDGDGVLAIGVLPTDELASPTLRLPVTVAGQEPTG